MSQSVSGHLLSVALLGAGGGSRDLLDIFEASNQVQSTYNVLGYIVDPEYASMGQVFSGKPVLGGFDWLAQHVHEVQVICGLGASELRRRLIERAAELGAIFCSIIHPSVIHGSSFSVGQGTSIGAGCVITNNVHIGDHVQINVGCTISHDCILSDYGTLSPGTHIAGNVIVGEGCFVGIGAVSIEKVSLGHWSIIGAGSTIVNDVPPNTTVVGVPGKVIKTRPEGWHLA